MKSRRTVLGGLAGTAVVIASPMSALGARREEHWVQHDAANGCEPQAHFAFGTMDGQPQGWSAHNAGRPYSCQTSRNDKELRLELHAGDQWSYDAANSPQVERTMVQAGTDKAITLPLSSEVWWAFSFLLEPGAPVTALGAGYDWVIIAAIHSDYSTTHVRAVPIQFELHPGDLLAIQTHGDFFPANRHIVYETPTGLARGVWHDMVLRTNMDPVNASGQGGTTVWLDGQKIYDYAGPLGYAKDLPYVQFQVYRSSPDPKTVPHEAVAIRFANHDVQTSRDLRSRVGRSPAFPRGTG